MYYLYYIIICNKFRKHYFWKILIIDFCLKLIDKIIEAARSSYYVFITSYFEII